MFSLMPWRKERHELAPRSRDPFGEMRHEFGRLFDRFFGEFPLLPDVWEKPAWGVETEESEKEYLLRVELPGFELSEVTAEVKGDVLTVRAEHKEAPTGDGDKKVEGRYATVSRTLTLPLDADLDKLEATYRNGVLEVRVPKVPEALGRRIDVKA